MIENEIRTLLHAPAAGDGAPSLERLEYLLTSGYARSLGLEAERWRLERRIADVAVKLADEHNELRAAELGRLGRSLKQANSDLASLRALLDSLRRRADAARAA